MTRILMMAVMAMSLSGCMETESSNPAGERQATATRQNMDGADKQVGMPRITHYTQRKLLKNAYEDMDQVIITYAYTQGLDGKFLCIGQSLGYSVSLGTQFTAPTYPQYIYLKNAGDGGHGGVYDQAQPEPNGLYMPNSGDSSIVNLIDPKTGHAHTSTFESHVNTVPFKLPSSVVSAECPPEVDPASVVDEKEVSTHKQRD